MIYASKRPDMAIILIHVCNMNKGNMCFVIYSLYFGILVQKVIYHTETWGGVYEPISSCITTQYCINFRKNQQLLLPNYVFLDTWKISHIPFNPAT